SAAGLRAARQAAWGVAIPRLTYLVVMVYQTTIVIGFLAYYVAPKFKVIFRDFGLKLPWVTEQVMRLTSSDPVRGWILVTQILGFLVAILMGFIPFALIVWLFLDLA